MLIPAHARKNTHTHMHTRTRTYAHARTHARTHTHTHDDDDDNNNNNNNNSPENTPYELAEFLDSTRHVTWTYQWIPVTTTRHFRRDVSSGDVHVDEHVDR